jgi:hypothetical protein
MVRMRIKVKQVNLQPIRWKTILHPRRTKRLILRTILQDCFVGGDFGPGREIEYGGA